MNKLSKTTVAVLATMIGMLIFVTGCGRVEWECIKDDGSVTITGIKGGAQESPSGELKIPESIDGVTVRTIAPGAFRGYGKLTSVEIPPSVVSIGEDAFRDCAQLSFVQIPASVKEIGRYAFVGSGELKVKIQNGVREIWPGAFCACHGLVSVDIPPSVKSIGPYAFAYCEGLKSFEIPSTVSIIDQCAFISCTGLESLIIPRSVERVGDGAFKGCSGLTSLKFSQGKMVIGKGAFADCTALPQVDVPLAVRPTDVDAGVFDGCINLSRIGTNWSPRMFGVRLADNFTLVIPKGVVRYYGRGRPLDAPYSGWMGLISVELPDGLEIIGEEAFAGMGVKSITIPASVKRIDCRAFQNCRQLAAVRLSEGLESIELSSFEGSGIKSVSIPASVKEIGSFAFRGCNQLALVEFADGLERIGEEAFADCGIRSVKIPVSVKHVGRNAFRGCDQWKE